VEGRIKELELDYQITEAKVTVIMEEIKEQDGGPCELNKAFEKTNAN
jgi:hypothetical protein